MAAPLAGRLPVACSLHCNQRQRHGRHASYSSHINVDLRQALCGTPLLHQQRSAGLSRTLLCAQARGGGFEGPGRGGGRSGGRGGRGGRGRGRGPEGEGENEDQRQEEDDGFQERVVQVSRVTKVVKGGKQLSFRAVVVVGDEKGRVGVGCATAKEVVQAVAKAVVDAKRGLVMVPLTSASSFPHRVDAFFGAAKVMLRPASDGTGVIAGGAVRTVLELAGIKNAFGKQLGSGNPLNNARATLVGLNYMRTHRQVAAARDLTLEEMLDRIKSGRGKTTEIVTTAGI